MKTRMVKQDCFRNTSIHKQHKGAGSIIGKHPVNIPELGMIVYIDDAAKEQETRRKYLDYHSKLH